MGEKSEQATAADTKAVADLQHAVKQFERAQHKHRAVGAEDTEPDWVFQDVLARALRGEKVRVPTTPQEWQLFTTQPKVAQAAKELATVCAAAVAAIQDCSIRDSHSLRTYLQNYCWRVTV